MAKLWRGYLAPCGEVTKAVARLLSLLWQGYQICGEITCGEVTLWRGYSQVTGDGPVFRWNQLPGMTEPSDSFTARGPVTLTAILFTQPAV